MKLTLVIDTDDEAGIRDTYKIVNHFYKRIAPRPRISPSELRFGKINFIKMLRAFAGEARTSEELGDDSTSLRYTKRYADQLFDAQSESI